jgi:hypothetical protein
MKSLTRQLAMTIAISLLLPVAGVLAQSSTTRVYGTVKDTTGAVIAGAKITLIENASGRPLKNTTTTDEGTFVFPDIPPGSYTVVAEQTGFKKAEVKDIKVDVGIPATVNLDLEQGAIGETVTVTASDSQSVINSESAELANVVSKRQIVDLPLNGRNPMQLAGLQAGVAGNAGNRTAAINGQRGTFSNITWDGVNVNDNFVRTDSLFNTAAPNVEGVSEFSITTQNGDSSGGLGVAQIKLVTPRGTNQYHGSVFEFHRNNIFDSNTFFNNAAGRFKSGDTEVLQRKKNIGDERLPKPKLIQNQFGYNVGGPIPFILKNKLFFYTWFEGIRVRSDAQQLRTVLSPAARQGIFQYRAAVDIPSQNIKIGDLRTVNLFSLPNVRSADPKIAGLIGLTPTPNDTGAGDGLNTGGYRFNIGNPTNSESYGFRIDYELTQNHRFEAIWNTFNFKFPNDTFNDIGSVFPGLIGGGQDSNRPRGSYAWHWTISNNITNELRGGFFNTNPNFFNNEPFADGYRIIFPISTSPVQNFLPQGRVTKDTDFHDNASWVAGRHLVRFGGNLRILRTDNFNDVGIVPQYNLGFNATGNPNPLSSSQFPAIATNDFTTATNLLALLGGYVGSASATFNAADRNSGFVLGSTRFREIDYKALGTYVNDSWRFRPNLSINLGLRHEYITVPTEKSGLALLPVDSSIAGLLDPNAKLDFAGGDTGRNFFKDDLNNFAPNVSFAWDPFKDGKTSVRAGYSISYVIDNNITTVQSVFNGNSGLSQGVTLSNVSGTVSGNGIVAIPPPAFIVPRTQGQNIALSSGANLDAIDPNLATPYVQQWTFSIEREIMRNTAVEVRYVGNRGVKLTRAYDLNLPELYGNGFFADFLKAQANVAAARVHQRTVANTPISGAFNANVPGSQQLSIFPRFGLGGNLANGTIVNLLEQGQVGELATQYLLSRTTFLTGANNTLTPGFFLTNPNANQVWLIGNNSYSNYNALQMELRRRLSNGLYFQTNYTYSKALTDFEGSQSNFFSLLQNSAGGVTLDKKRANFDVTHIYKANFIYELPFGRGRQFLNFDSGAANSILDGIFGGWQLGGILEARSGRPISIVSARGTNVRAASSGNNTVNTGLSIPDLQSNTGLFYDAQGRPVIFNPSFIGTDGRAVATAFQNPAAGTLGNLALTPVSGPGFFNLDMNVLKNFRVTERVGFTFRAEAFNIMNRTNFFIGEAQNINSTTFGRVTDTFAPRILQMSLKLNF